jgi:7-alpha-hydroxysteroid dehydrogenase
VTGILDQFLLTDKVALVTGGGRGIGAATALGFADAGADVAIAARTPEQLEEVAQEIRARGRRALILPADVNDLDGLPSLVERTVAEFGRLDVLVNNAGGTAPRPLLETSNRAFEEAFHFNVTTAFALTRAAVPHLLESGTGSVVNISSVMGRIADRGYSAYGTAKAALSHLTRLLAADLAPRVRVNGIAVGSVATTALDTVLTNDDLRTTMERQTPLRRIGNPIEIAATALWLASPAGAFVTGKVMEVDGGLQIPNLALGLPDL